MSYAEVTASNTLPLSQQPKPDPALLTTPEDVGLNVNTTRGSTHGHSSAKRHEYEKKAHKHVEDAEEEGIYLWNVAKQYLLRPGVAGGLVGIVNLGLLGGASRAFYTQPELRNNTRVISTTIAAALGLIAVEGYAAEQYRKTPRGQDEERRARAEGSVIYKHSKEIVLRPGVLGGLVGLLNTAILGTVGYYSYINWDKPTWDRRIISAVSVGLLILWGGEGVLAERYRENRHR